MQKEIIRKVRTLVKSESSYDDWNHHLTHVVRHAMSLVETTNADKYVVELAALLHDIGRTRIGQENHEMTGEKEARKILLELGADNRLVEHVASCIRNHRASIVYQGDDKETLIIRDADAMSHFDAITYIIKAGLKKFEGDTSKASKWVKLKLTRDWKNKIHFKISKERIRKKYEAAMLLL